MMKRLKKSAAKSKSTYKCDDIVLVKLQRVWWPGYVVEIEEKQTICSFWNEDILMPVATACIRPFNAADPVIDQGKEYLRKKPYLCAKYAEDVKLAQIGVVPQETECSEDQEQTSDIVSGEASAQTKQRKRKRKGASGRKRVAKKTRFSKESVPKSQPLKMAPRQGQNSKEVLVQLQNSDEVIAQRQTSEKVLTQTSQVLTQPQSSDEVLLHSHSEEVLTQSEEVLTQTSEEALHQTHTSEEVLAQTQASEKAQTQTSSKVLVHSQSSEEALVAAHIVEENITQEQPLYVTAAEIEKSGEASPQKRKRKGKATSGRKGLTKKLRTSKVSLHKTQPNERTPLQTMESIAISTSSEKVLTQAQYSEEVLPLLQSSEEVQAELLSSEEVLAQLLSSEEVQAQLQSSDEVQAQAECSEEVQAQSQSSEKVQAQAESSEEVLTQLLSSEEVLAQFLSSEEVLAQLQSSEEVQAQTESSEEVQAQLQSSDEIQAQAESSEEVQAQLQSSDEVQAQAESSEEVLAQSQSSEKVQAQAEYSEEVQAQLQSSEEVLAQSQSSEEVLAKAQSSEEVQAELLSSEEVLAKAQSSEKVQPQAEASEEVVLQLQSSEEVLAQLQSSEEVLSPLQSSEKVLTQARSSNESLVNTYDKFLPHNLKKNIDKLIDTLDSDDSTSVQFEYICQTGLSRTDLTDTDEDPNWHTDMTGSGEDSDFEMDTLSQKDRKKDSQHEPKKSNARKKGKVVSPEVRDPRVTSSVDVFGQSADLVILSSIEKKRTAVVDPRRVPESEDETEPMQAIDLPRFKSNDEDFSSCDEVDEEEAMRSTTNTNIYVRCILKAETTKTGKKKKSNRVYNTVHECPICNRLYKNWAHHIVTHTQKGILQEIKKCKNEEGEDPSVTKSKKGRKEILMEGLGFIERLSDLEYEKDEAQAIRKQKVTDRKRLMDNMRRKSDHMHNVRVLQMKKGEIILGRRPNKEEKFDVNHYGPCPHCLEWLKNSTMRRHQSCCPAVDNKVKTESKGVLLTESAVLAGTISHQASDALVKEVFTTMLHDDIGTLAREDPLIITSGNMWLLKNMGNELKRAAYTSQVMRLNARLLKTLRDTIPEEQDKNMIDFLQPCHFDDVVSAALACSAVDMDDEEELTTPSNAIKLGFEIKRLVAAKRGFAIRTKNQVMKDDCRDFMDLMVSEWAVKVTKIARISLQAQQNRKKSELPLPSDIQKLSVHLNQQLLELDLEDASIVNFRRICQLVEAKLVVYNRRRSGEVQAIKVMNYLTRVSGIDEVDKAMTRELTEFERHLLLSQDVMKIRGKTGKGVPVLVPLELNEAIQFLACPDNRQSAGVHKDNTFLFAATGGAKAYVRAYESLSKVASEAGLSAPWKITSVALRKYMATVSQVLDMTQAQEKWLFEHLGHTQDVHMLHYRSRSSVLERVEVAKLCLIQDNNLVKSFVGKRLEDIQLPDVVYGKATTIMSEPSDSCIELNNTVGDEGASDEIYSLLDDDRFFGDEDDGGAQDVEKRCPRPRAKRMCPVQRSRWCKKEIDELNLLFKDFIAAKKCPGQKDCEKAMKISKEMGGEIWKKKRDNIKKKVSYINNRSK